MLRRLVLVLLVLDASFASARCTDPGAINVLAQNLAVALRCAQSRLLQGPGAPCPTVISPPCAPTALGDILNVVAPGAPSAIAQPLRLRQELRCQAAIWRASLRFLRLRLPERFAGRRGEGLSRFALNDLAKWCAVRVESDSTGVTVPRLGGSCGLGVPGTALQPRSVENCLRGSLEEIADGIAPAPLPPNIVVILTDDQRWDTLAYMPHVMDDLARRGVTFHNSFVTTALCAPSRASLYSGQYAHNHGITNNFVGAAARFDGTKSIAVALSAAGYTTGLFGKYINGNDRLAPAVPPGWDAWQTFVENGDQPGSQAVYYNYTLNENGTLVHYTTDYSTDLLRDRTLAFIQANAGKPFFVVYAPFAPHKPAVPAPRHAGELAGLPLWRPPNWDEADVSGKPLWVQFTKFITTPDGVAVVDKFRTGQLETLLAVDEAVAAFSGALETLGLTDDTAVFYASDNGYHWSEHWWSWKQTPYEEAVRVPLVVRYPRLAPAPTAREQMALNIDYAPTFAALAGVPIPPWSNGQSLIPVLLADAPWRADFLAENPPGVIVSMSSAVRTSQWKYIKTNFTQGVTDELYDLAVDPYELQNLALDGMHADVVGAMTVRLGELEVQ